MIWRYHFVHCVPVRISPVAVHRWSSARAREEVSGVSEGTTAVPAEPRGTRTALLDQPGRRAPSASVLGAFWHEYELSRRRRALQQLVRAARFGERQALGHDRVDLATTKQLKQREEVLPEPIRVAVAQLVDPRSE